jgi:hypothetical protein
MYIEPSLRVSALGFAHARKGDTAMPKADLCLVEGTFMDEKEGTQSAFLQMDRAFPDGPIQRLGKSESMAFGMSDSIEQEAELFAIVEQLDFAEKTFHDALARRNEAQIAYLHEPSIRTREALDMAKTAEAVALKILSAEVGWLASTRATTVVGLKLKASYASTEGKLADSIVEDILHL